MVMDSKKKFVLIGLLPIVFMYALIFLYPILRALFISFTNMKLLKRGYELIGFENYIKIINDQVFIKSFLNTLYFTVVYLFITVVVGLLIALFINSLSKLFQNIIKVILFLPVITLTISAGLIWQWMYAPSFGILNYLLSLIGLGPFVYLVSPNMVIPSIVIFVSWKWIGINIIIFLAGLQSIPNEYYEAAKIDGANSLKMFRSVTLPLLIPTIEFIFITTVLASLQVFTEIFILTRGGPGTSSRSIAFHVYEVGFKFLKMGEAAAVAFILFAFILILTIFQFRVFRREEIY